MESVHPERSIIALAKKLFSRASQERHRYVIALSGNEDWCNRTVDLFSRACFEYHQVRQSEQSTNDSEERPRILNVGMEDSSSFRGKQCEVGELGSLLGTEWDLVIWNGFNEISANGLGIVSGAISAGGLFCILLATRRGDTRHGYQEKLKRDESSCKESNFYQRMLHFLSADDHVIHVDQWQQTSCFPSSQCSPPVLDQVSSPGKYPDQTLAIQGILKVANGHRNRPLVIEADRGRGKTSALGMAAATLLKQRLRNIVITAPSKDSVRPAFEFFSQLLGNDLADLEQGFRFEPPDLLLKGDLQVDLLMIDEAAALPVPVLKQLLLRYPRIVFSTTIHGYEGSGRGFEIRFKKSLEKHSPAWRRLVLNKPIRWAEGDPLETFTSALLLLNSSPVSDEKLLSVLPAAKKLTQEQVRWISGDELSRDETLLNQVFGLLVLAHYKTRPDDLHFLLDSTNLRIGVLDSDGCVVGVLLALEEGGLNDHELVADICQGIRRPKGNLAAQKLAMAYMEPLFLSANSLRVMRIAVHPRAQRQGFGRVLVTALQHYASKNNFQWLTVSYGLTLELFKFWATNEFHLLHCGFHQQASSQEFSALGIRVVTPIGCSSPPRRDEQLLVKSVQSFSRRFLCSLCRDHNTLPVDLVAAVVANLYENTPLDSGHRRFLAAFASGTRSYEETVFELHALICSSSFARHNHLLDSIGLTVLVAKVLLNQRWDELVKLTDNQISGKKQALFSLRESVFRILRD